MTASEPSTPEGSLAERVRAELATLERELAEIDMLIAQARTEAGRHETKRAAAADRLAALRDRRGVEPGELLELSGQLVTLTKRAALMEAQVDVLEGKKKALGRFRDSLAGLLDGLVDFEERTAASPAGSRSAGSAPGLPPGGEPGSATVGELSPAVSRLVLTAQEDLRRQIARAIHDGPAQALTNIVLQAEIVERLLPAGDERIRREVERLVAMVEHTL
ncbi:MAG TPA: histidine kinase dimerization/phosphoacceptor domain-containing protein, partial [Candidatus Limnocylindrales bacterium]|nr:histidine kinase dimerization/phosphoacceptor domain-containing protein [Candidatus Limnocylindrales bacterium]